MRVAIFGGTGRTGARLITEARAAGFRVRALARDPHRLPCGTDVEGIEGDVTDPSAVLATVAGVDAVLSALGGGPVDRPGTILSDGMRHIVAAAGQYGVRRVVAVAGSGVLDHPTGGLRSEQPGFPGQFRAINAEHLGTVRALAESHLEWTVLGCPDLVEAPATGRYLVVPDLLPEGVSRINTGDVAHCMVRMLIEQRFLRRRAGIGALVDAPAVPLPAAAMAGDGRPGH